MVPAQCGNAIAPRHVDPKTTFIVFEREDILAVIGAEIDAVFVGEFVIELGIEVVEKITRACKWRGI